MRSRKLGGQVVVFGIASAALGAATASRAELGSRTASIEADRAHLAATMAMASAPNHMTYTLTPTRGGIVHEYANADGMVFAISWRSPGRPDLRQLLGAHFAGFQSGLAARGPRRMSRHVAVQRSNLVVRSAGHPGAFFGIAYLPSLMPQGVTVDDLR